MTYRGIPLLFRCDQTAAAAFFGGVFAADEMAFDQHLFVERAKVVHRFREMRRPIAASFRRLDE